MKYKYIFFYNLGERRIENPQRYVKCLGYEGLNLTLAEHYFSMKNGKGEKVECGILFPESIFNTFKPNTEVMVACTFMMSGENDPWLKQLETLNPGTTDVLKLLAEDILVVDTTLTEGEDTEKYKNEKPC